MSWIFPPYNPPENPPAPAESDFTLTFDNIYARVGAIDVTVTIKNNSVWSYSNLKIWAGLKLIKGSYKNEYFYQETKPLNISSLNSGRTASRIFNFTDPNIEPNYKFLITVYLQTDKKLYKWTKEITIPPRPCTSSDFRKDDILKLDVTNTMVEIFPDTFRATLYVYLKTAQLTTDKIPETAKEKYEMWKKGYTILTKKCPYTGKYLNVKYKADLFVYTKGDKGDTGWTYKYVQKQLAEYKEPKNFKETALFGLLLGTLALGIVLYVMKK